MRVLLTNLACAAALCAGTAAHAGVVTFDDPAVIAITPDGTAVYTEAGFTLSGQAASFLTLDEALVSGFDAGSISLMALDGLPFGLQSFEYAFFDLGFGSAPGVLSVQGLLNGSTVVAQSFALGENTAAMFGSPWAHLTEVRFSGTTGFALDNITVSAVPEPGTLGLVVLALATLGWRTRWSGLRKSA